MKGHGVCWAGAGDEARAESQRKELGWDGRHKRAREGLKLESQPWEA